MGLFGGKEEVIDYTLLEKYRKKKGSAETAKNVTNNTANSGIIDFTTPAQNNSSGVKPETAAENGFDFLNTFDASAAENKPAVESGDNLMVKHLSVKIEDLEYKIQQLVDQINRIEDKIK